LAAAAALFAACSSDSNDLAEKQTAKNEPMAVGFDAYVNRGTTRAGQHYGLDNTALETCGFGVFSYYTDNQPYSQSATPNFMYNQKVEKASSGWIYSPIKYWPNEFGGNAISDGEDRLTFFAYAPFVNVNAGTGRINQTIHTADDALTSGIVGLTSNVTSGDPYVKYYVDLTPANRVDLCYGVARADYSAAVTGATQNTITAGEPYIDVIKPDISSKISFDFKHALASLNVQIDADVDDAEHNHSNSVDANTKIFVRSITFEGFATKGLLNLNSPGNDPQWFELSSTNTKIGSGSVTVYDGRRDGKEGQASGEASNEKPFDLNPTIIQKDTDTDGVTSTQVNLFNSNTATSPVFVIPNRDPLKVTIVYDVETKDPNVAGFLSDGKTHGSTVENKITKEIKSKHDVNITMGAGYQYTVYLHLGMTSVKVDASVSDWVNSHESNTDLPVNSK
jgi:hypothetical protein